MRSLTVCVCVYSHQSMQRICTYSCFNVTKRGGKNMPIKYILIKYTKGHLKFNCTGVALVLSECIYQIKIVLWITVLVIINVLKVVSKL